MILVAGHSHTMALVGNPRLETPTVQPAEGRPDVWAVYGPRTERYFNLLVESSPNRTVALSWRGDEYVAQFLIQTAVPFDFVYHKEPTSEVDGSLVLVPETMVKAYFKRSVEELILLLKRLVNIQVRSLFLVGSPPPKREDLIRAGMRIEPYYVKILQERGMSPESVNIAPEALRLKLWKLHQDCIQQAGNECGAVFIAPPAACTDQEGFLLPTYSDRDATHANWNYGTLVMDQIRLLAK